MLEVAVQRKHIFSRGCSQPVSKGAADSVGGHFVDRLNSGIFACKLFDDDAGLIGAVVVYEHDLMNVIIE